MSGNGMPQIGDVVAEKYRLEKVAGEGGMGIVYVAEHLVLSQRVAVKVLLTERGASEATIERFSREARAAAKINSEHVARVLDAGSTKDGSPFLVMEFLEGCDLEELLQLQRTLPVIEAVDYTVQALEGLAHAHAANIVHRDLKPANLFLATLPDGSNAIKLLDFGISKSMQGKAEDKRLTGQAVLGSPVYMSPEQLRNSTDIDVRADVWSIGIVLYEMLAGDPPFDGEGVGEIFAAILEKEPVPLTERNPKIPAPLSDVVLKCLRRNPDERWQDVGELAHALAPFASESEAGTIERAEQVLARSTGLGSIRTPITPRPTAEARRIVEAAHAARNVKTETGRESEPLLLLKQPKAASRRPLVLAGVAVLIVGLGVLGVLRAMRGTPATTLAQASTHAPPGPQGSNAPAPSGSAATDSNDDGSEAPMLMDLPSTPNKPASARGKSPGAKPQRPKFLNSRE